MTANAARKLSGAFEPTYRDELNFAEFPLALLDRPSEGQKTIAFSDTIFDHGRRVPVTRKLTISASDKYGLPTPRDEEVILGLIQLSHQVKFAERKVFFTKGDLVRLLGWSDDGRSYERIAEALNKWAGITLFWEKSWWSKEEQCWVDETFHILDNVTLYDRERYSRRLEQSGGEALSAMSSFVWNDVVFASFKSGNIKQLDLDFYKSLDSAISKKMFRYLDKRFYKTRKLDFDLRVFALEHIGLSRNYHNGEIKRRLRPAIKELEEKGFLERLPDEKRFVARVRGEWDVLFIRKGAPRSSAEEPATSGVGSELVKRGVGAKVAKELAASFAEERIREKIALHDSLTQLTDNRAPKNPPGFLVAAIRDDFAVRSAHAVGERRAVPSHPAATPAKSQILQAARKNQETESDREFQKFEIWWESLSISQRETHEREAIASADKFSLRQYEDGKERPGKLFDAARKSILFSHYRRRAQL